MANRESILIIEDIDDTRELFEVGLPMYGYKTYTARDGQEGLDLYEKHRCPVAIVDVMLPSAVTEDLNGYKVSAKIKEKNPDAIVIIVTGATEPEQPISKVRILDSHADIILTKPVTVDQVVTEIQYIQAKRDAIKPRVLRAPSNRLMWIGLAILFGALVVGLCGISAASYHFYAVETARHGQEMMDLRRDEDRRFLDLQHAMERETDMKLAQMQGQINYLEPRVLTLEKELSRMHGEIGRKK